MKKEDELIVIPQKKPETIKDVLDWHKKLLSDCLKYEIKKQVIESSISELNRLIEETVTLLGEEVYSSAAKLKLQSINELLEEARENLLATKTIIKTLHRSNEAIIGSVVKSAMGEEKTIELSRQQAGTRPNLLHGHGWMLEYQAAKEQWEKGKAAFLTFGTFMDPAKVDLIVISKALDEKVEFDLDYRKIKESME